MEICIKTYKNIYINSKIQKYIEMHVEKYFKL